VIKINTVDMQHPDANIMRMAIEEAKKAFENGQYPLAAVVVLGDKILAINHTTLLETTDPSAHAEMNAIREAAKKHGSRYLEGAWLYTTQEPCPMCTGAAIWAKMAGIVFGANKDDALKIFRDQRDTKFTWRQINVASEDIILKGEPKLELHKEFMRDECLKLFELTKA
jgi:tRNA(Arg) A34 adenosine deaminase TadA